MMMDPEPKLSVIVPCLNEEKSLPLFLSSLRRQSLWYITVCSAYHQIPRQMPFPFDLIIVDGGSTDRSRKVIDSYGSKLSITKLIDLKRNLGYIRNLGAQVARSAILFFTNSDTILSNDLLAAVYYQFADQDLIALAGRTIPLDGGSLSVLAYTAFDCLRSIFTKLGRFSPSGNFLAVRASTYHQIGGFHNLRVNEDGELGLRLSRYAREEGSKIKFRSDLHVWHYVKRWSSPLRALAFYAYIFGNFHPILKKILQPIERKSSREFNQARDRRICDASI
jgi:glycosyltransferase involved in cell wall biosynthesis